MQVHLNLCIKSTKAKERGRTEAEEVRVRGRCFPEVLDHQERPSFVIVKGKQGLRVQPTGTQPSENVYWPRAESRSQLVLPLPQLTQCEANDRPLHCSSAHSVQSDMRTQESFRNIPLTQTRSLCAFSCL